MAGLNKVILQPCSCNCNCNLIIATLTVIDEKFILVFWRFDNVIMYVFLYLTAFSNIMDYIDICSKWFKLRKSKKNRYYWGINSVFFFFNFELYLSFFALPLGALPLGTDIVVLPIRLSFNFWETYYYVECSSYCKSHCWIQFLWI